MALAIFGTFNLNVASSGEKDNDVNLKIMVTNANAQTEYNDPSLWFSQGLTKDEREISVACPESTTSTTGGSISGGYKGVTGTVSGSTTTTNNYTSGQTHITCGSGNDNCTETDC
ncbi:hypothetical protein [Flavobacterium sp. RS13.1]|uniref:hypothetical protein n=1 Tax=Flavobacterium sp. RS13.1 TaxID=3400345 RepID=UPI003AAE1C3B